MVFASVLILIPMGIRGTVSHKPLNPSNGSFCSNPLANTIPVNSAFNVFYAFRHMGNNDVKKSQIFAFDEIANIFHNLPYLSKRTIPSTFDSQCAINQTISPEVTGKKRNVVVILEESFGSRYVKSLGGDYYDVVGYGNVEFTKPDGSKLDLPPGSYTMIETNTPAMFDECSPYSFVVSVSDGTSSAKTYTTTKVNKITSDKVKLTKVDSETGKTVADAGIRFGYVDPNTGKDVIIASGYTDQSGLVRVRNDAPNSEPWKNYEIEVFPGTYFYEEFSAPSGYERDTKRYEQVISETNNGGRTITCEIKDKPKKGSIEIYKKGDLFADAVVEDDGTTTPIFEEGYLAGAEFTIYANKDIVTGDGTVRNKKDSVVAVLVTDSKGKARVDGLYLGEYRIEETKAPDGYEPTFDTKVVTLSDSKLVEALTATDAKNTVSIKANKEMEEDSYEQINPQDEITKVKFGIF